MINTGYIEIYTAVPSTRRKYTYIDTYIDTYIHIYNIYIQ